MCVLKTMLRAVARFAAMFYLCKLKVTFINFIKRKKQQQTNQKQTSKKHVILALFTGRPALPISHQPFKTPILVDH